MSSQIVKILGVLWVAGLLSSFQASPAHGFASYDLSGLTTDLIATPDQHLSWDPDTPGGNVTTLTYRFDASFTTDERIRAQIRLGIQQWDDVNITPYGATYSYLRTTGYQPFYDIRGTTVHEMGHSLALDDLDLAAPLGLNFGFNPTPPPTVIAQPRRDDEVMSYGFSLGAGPGSYNQILSHDELDGYRYLYGNRDFNFIEISSGTPNILFKAEPAPGMVAYWIWNGVPRDPADATKGSRFTSGEIIFDTGDIDPVGFRTLGQNWDVRNTSGKATRGIEIQTRGTYNTEPIDHFNGDPTGFRFGSLSTASTGDPDHKDDLLHTWSDPRFWTAPVDIPAGSLHHIGLEQDVWDWTVISARTVNADFTKTYVPLVSFSQWNQTVTGVDVTTSSRGIIRLDSPPEIAAEGIRIVNTEDSPCDLVEIGVAVVDGRDLGLADLNRSMLEQLVDEGIFETFDIVPRMLDYAEVLFLVLDGSPTGITNTVFLDRPDLLGHELFIYAETRTLDATVGSYALLGTPPIAMAPVPEPSTLALAAVGLLVFLGYAWRRRDRRR